jgi:hypothetical protein
VKRAQTIAQRRKLRALTAEMDAAAAQRAFEQAPARLREVRRVELVKARAKALRLGRAAQ